MVARAVARTRRGFTLIELLIVIIIIALLMALILPALVKALCNARQAATKAMCEQLHTASKKYETDFAVYPPGDGTGSSELASFLGRPGPKQLEYFTFSQDMLINGDILNPTWPDNGPPADIIYYRNNIDPASAGGGGGGQPPVFFRASVDIWAAGCSYTTARPSSAWGVSNFE